MSENHLLSVMVTRDTWEGLESNHPFSSGLHTRNFGKIYFASNLAK